MTVPWEQAEHRDFSTYEIAHKPAHDDFREHAIIWLGKEGSRNEWGMYIKPEWSNGADRMDVRIDTFGYDRNGEKLITVNAHDDHEAVERAIGVVMRAIYAARRAEKTGLPLAA